MNIKAWHAGALVLAVGVVAGALTSSCSSSTKTAGAVVFTVGDIYAVHAEVTLADKKVHGERRLSDGDKVFTGKDGRARIRLDDGTIVAVDGDTTVLLESGRLVLDAGRIFVQGGAGTRFEVRLGSATTTVSGSSAAFERAKRGETKVYCAQGELVLRIGDRQLRVASGETANLGQEPPRVVPEKAFNDWTGGLAVPWVGTLGEKSAIGEVRVLSEKSDPGSPLVIRSQQVAAEVYGELALTKTRTVYFNGGSSARHAKVRLALPDGAVLRRVARRRAGASSPDEALVATAACPTCTSEGTWEGLEWAGGGWLSGDLGSIDSGETLELELEYAEWLPVRDRRATYRFPMAGGEESPLVGELGAIIETKKAESPFVTASAGATVEEGTVRYRQADVRPTGDLVVELSPKLVHEGAARAYVASSQGGQDPYVMVRTEVPPLPEAGVTLAVVVDASMSVGAATLETERAVVDAVLEGLGPRDSIVVLAADQTLRPMGPASPEAVTEGLKDRVRKALAALRPGGASNIGLALQQASDILDSPTRGDLAGSGMVVYVGDGRPTVGEPDAERIRRLIGRRVAGVPRLGAIAVGPSADRWTLAKLVAGVGTVYEVQDRSDAARAGAALLADALEPTFRDVELDLGPTIDRVYPREARAVLAGSTVTVLGRLRGALPRSVGFRYRDGNRLVEESRRLERVSAPLAQDIPQRWALARVEEIAMRDEGIEPAIALAREARLLTPWTSWFFVAPSMGHFSSPFSERVLELTPRDDTPFAGLIDDLRFPGSTLLEPEARSGRSMSLAMAAKAAVVRVLKQAASSVRACRDARRGTRPDVGRSFTIDLSVSGDGHASRVIVRLADKRGTDPVLERCIKGVVESLPYFAAGLPVDVNFTLTVPEGRSSRRTQCSAASKVALPLRRTIWRSRAPLTAESYVSAAESCELPRWRDRRAFLLVAWEGMPDPGAALNMAEQLAAAGEGDAADFMKREALRRVTSFGELQTLRARLMMAEPEIDEEFELAFKKAPNHSAQLAVVRRFLRLAPHSSLVRRRLISLLEATGQREALVREIESIRGEPFVDAGLLAQGASALRRIGYEMEASRAFGELVERAPRDPWTLAYVGDRLRAEGQFDEAVAAYSSLELAMPNDAAVGLRMALAHAGAGRLDVATRLLERVTQTGGRGDDGRLGELSSIVQAVLLANARGASDSAVRAELERRLLQTPLPDVKSIVLVQSAPADEPVQVSIIRDMGEKAEQSPDLDAATLGLAAVRVERGQAGTRVLLRRTIDRGPSRPAKATVAALVLGGEHGNVKLVTREVEVSADGKPVELRFDGEIFL